MIGTVNGAVGCIYDGIANSPPSPPTTGTGTVTMTAPSTPGTYYISVQYTLWFSCAQAVASGSFSGTDPARYIGAIVVVEPPPAPQWVGIRLTNVQLNGSGNMVAVPPGSQVSFSTDYSIVDCGCPGCIDWLQIGFTHTGPSGCIYSGIPGCSPDVGAGALTLVAPVTPGLYYVSYDQAADYVCTPGWWNGTPPPSRSAGIVIVR